MRPIWRFLIGQAVLLVALVSLPWVAIAAVPGVLGATAPILCPAEQPDSWIVEYHTDLGDSTGTSWTLVCMGPGGDITEVGSWRPLGIVFGALLLAGEALVLPVQLIGIARRRRRGPQAPGPPRPGRRIQIGVGFNP
ncbi:MAG TPA: hypothetical protein VFU19_15250 [Iamia sp.]|nr:hypothetical protein [Iamia sp.]